MTENAGEVTIREIRPTDYRDVYWLNVDFNPNFRTFSEERVKRRIEIIASKTKDVVFVGERDGQVIGYIHGSPYELLFSDSLVNVLGFVVKKELRNQGIGSLLIGRLEQWGRITDFPG